jgi:hypothetical protein
MAGGRPRKDEGEQTTRQVRLAEELADKLYWVTFFARGGEPDTSSDYIRAHLGARIDADYAKVAKRAEAVQRLREKERKLKELVELGGSD